MNALSFILVLFETVTLGLYVAWVVHLFPDLSFAQPWVLALLLPLVALAASHLLGARRARFVFSYTGIGADVPQSLAEVLRPAVTGLGVVGLALLIIAAARPQTSIATSADTAEGIDIVFALDVSGSMEAADFKPNNRLFVAKEVLSEFINQRKTDRLGLVVFAGEAYTQVPLTLDYSVIVNLLGDVRTGVIADGTAIGDALGTSVNRLRDQPTKSRIIILLTDGDNNAGALPPLEAAQIAADLGIRVYTILIGKDGPVPFPQGKDLFGNVVYTQVKIPINPELMKEIAERTKATSFRAEDRESLQRGLRAALEHLDKTQFEETGSQAKEELFARFLYAGLALVVLERILRLTRFREALD